MTSKLNTIDLAFSHSGSPPILNGLTLNFPSGQITGIMGASGSGKSTLLRCLNRLWEPPRGSVYLDGSDITAMDVVVLRKKVGLLFQSPVLFEGTVAQNVAFGPELHGRKFSRKRLLALLALAALPPAMAAKPATELSGGEIQRVALARVLANGPQVLLLDEPTSALDDGTTQKVEQTILQLCARSGITVVWVSHTFEQLQRVAGGLVYLKQGRVVYSGPVPQRIGELA